jgi:type II secretory pathway predicted ATPase ExeA
MQRSRLEILDSWKFKRDPFKGVRLETADSLRTKRLLNMAIDSKAMFAIVAERGCGKTEALSLALKDRDVHVVNLLTPDKGRVVVSDIEKGIIIALGRGEKCKRTKEVRARQVRRILGQASEEKPVVLILEEAHRMHGQTLRALKTFREMTWKGKGPIFTTVMVGQYNPLHKDGVSEVRLRSDVVYMKGITSSEIKKYIDETVGRCFSDDAKEAVAKLKHARNFLELQEILIVLMGKALQGNAKEVTAIEVFEVYGGGLKELMKRVNMTLPQLAEATGIHKSTLSLVTNGKQNSLTDSTYEETRAAITSVLRKQLKDTKGEVRKIS